jgi:hypothetical protein
MIVLTAILAGCTASTGPGGEFDAARQRWDELGPADYRMTITRSCECLPEMTGPVRVEVHRGVVATRQYVATGDAVPAELADLFPTVPGLFAIVEDARRRRAPRMEVTFDPTLGFPARISVDYVATTVDDEVVYTATDFQPL